MVLLLYMVLEKDILGGNIELAKKRLVGNLEGRGAKLRQEHIFRTGFGEASEAAQAEYEELRAQMGYALKSSTQVVPNFEYLPEQAEMFYSYVAKNDGLFLAHGRFAGDLDIQRLAKIFAESSPKQKDYIRRAFVGVYHIANIRQFLSEDYSSIEMLLEAITRDAESQSDKIQKLQYSWFVGNLTDILQRLK